MFESYCEHEPRMERTTRIPICDLLPDIEAHWDDFNAAFQQVLRSGRFILGPIVEAFEEEAAAFLDIKHAVGVNSGTDALIIGLRSLDVGPGDEVVTASFSNFATAEAIEVVGATPVFADIDENTFNIDPRDVAQRITTKTKALLPVHMFGLPAGMTELMQIAADYGLAVIEDCAHSFGACLNNANSKDWAISQQPSNGTKTGTIGHVGAFSFFPTKTLGTFGDGGLLVTDDDGIADTARVLRIHGSRAKYFNETVGYNSRLDAIQAAMLRVKLPLLDQAIDRSRRLARFYDNKLASIPGIVLPTRSEGHIYHQYTIRVLDGKRDRLKTGLSQAGIDTMIYYPAPLDQIPLYAGRSTTNRVGARISKEVLSLPLWPAMDEVFVEWVANDIERQL